MIKLSRERTPKAITATLRGKSRVDKNVALLKLFRNGTISGSELKNYWSKAKNQLKKESFGKCAYCEAPTDSVSFGDVEHFRPKSSYWWLAYCIDNYTYSCQICNELYKGMKFPIDGVLMAIDPPLPNPITDAELRTLAARLCPDPLHEAEGLPRAAFAAALQNEKAGLVDPYLFDPEPFFKWVANATLMEVRIKPRNYKSATKKTFAAVEECLGLNREELRRLRWRTYEYLETFKDLLSIPELPEEKKTKIKIQIRKMTDASAPFAGMARYFVSTAWKLKLD